MDGFTAGAMFWVFTLCVAFAGGRYAPLYDVSEDCSRKSETVIQSKVIKCTVVAVYIDGKRVRLTE